MLRRTIFPMLAGILFSPALIAQETDYKEAFFDYSSFTSFDVAVVTTQSLSDIKSTRFNLPYKVKLGNLQQVDSTGDFHVIALLQRLAM